MEIKPGHPDFMSDEAQILANHVSKQLLQYGMPEGGFDIPDRFFSSRYIASEEPRLTYEVKTPEFIVKLWDTFLIGYMDSGSESRNSGLPIALRRTLYIHSLDYNHRDGFLISTSRYLADQGVNCGPFNFDGKFKYFVGCTDWLNPIIPSGVKSMEGKTEEEFTVALLKRLINSIELEQVRKGEHGSD